MSFFLPELESLAGGGGDGAATGSVGLAVRVEAKMKYFSGFLLHGTLRGEDEWGRAYGGF